MKNSPEKMPKHVHVIGICGVATSALAVAFHKRGVKVTGSDKGFFPPVSTELAAQGVPFYAGWHPEKMTENGNPDVIVVGTASGTHNPETLYAKENGIPMYSFAEAIGKFFAKENSIICSGTWGKTSSSAMLSYILTQARFDPTYMFGGVSLSHESSAKLTESKWSVFEGDEYKSSPTDPKAKFFYYNPTHLLLTAVSWDHADLYPTEEEYFNAFKKLLAGIKLRQEQTGIKGFVVACANNPGVKQITNSYEGTVVYYGYVGTENVKYSYKVLTQSKDGLELEIFCNGNTYKIHSQMIGSYQAENIAGCFAMASELGVELSTIIKALGEFKGLKRRMEKRLDGKVMVLDDIAHSPEKAVSVLQTLRSIFKGKIVTVFEPNSGGRQRESASKYDNAFKDSDIVIIPRLTKLKISENEQPMEGPELTSVIAKTHLDVRYFEEDADLVNQLVSIVKEGDVIAFLGSHGFRSMIEETVTKL